jgi:RimJ/RimL family protein N-acetyltransferase
MASQTVLTTRRLRLRTWRAGDWHAYARHLNTDAVMEWLGGVMTPRQVRREVDWHLRHQQRHGFSFWVMERKRDRAFLGFCGLIRVGEVSSPICGKLEIGWRVRADMWRHRYALEAATAVLAWAAEHFPGEPVYARINIHNEGSIALAKRLGLRHVIGGDHTHPADRMRLAVYATPAANVAAECA